MATSGTPALPTPATSDSATCGEALNSLLRGEISAIETYEQALGKFANAAHQSSLTAIRDDHTRATQTLTEHVKQCGAEPSTGSGPWGAFTSVVTGAAKLIGPQSVLAALKQGEEHGISQYEKSLEADGLTAECKNLVRSDLLPRCRKHVSQLETLIATVETSKA